MNIVPFLRDDAFGPEDIQAMSTALDDVCNVLRLPGGEHPARLVIAELIIDLARQGERNPNALRDQALKETGLASQYGLLNGDGRN
jgi:hypothetical protein